MSKACALASLMLAVTGVGAQQNVLTWKYDNTRSGWNSQESILNISNVNWNNFGKLFSVPIDGPADAEPLYVSNLAILGQGTHNTLFLETEMGSIYAVDADNGALLWQTTSLLPGETPGDDRGARSGPVGIMATPVINLGMGPNGALYLASMSRDPYGQYHQRIHALDLTTGAELFGGPVDVQASYSGSGPNAQNGQVTFDPGMYKEQAALTQAGGMLITAWSSHGDIPPYNGWLIAYDEGTLQQVGVLCITPNGTDGAIWQSRSGPAVDASGFVYAMAANGTFDAMLDANGFPSAGDYGNALLKIDTSSGGLRVADYFAMHNVSQEDNDDVDLGSGGPVLLPPMQDAGGITRNLVVAAGKDRNIYVADSGNLGRFDSKKDRVYQRLTKSLSGQHYAAPTYFGGYLYFSASQDLVRAFSMNNGRVQARPTATTSSPISGQGMNMIVSSSGSYGGILWGIENSYKTATLHAYDASNFNGGALQEIYNTNQAPNKRDWMGGAGHLTTPLVINGKVYAAGGRRVFAYGLLSPQ